MGIVVLGPPDLITYKELILNFSYKPYAYYSSLSNTVLTDYLLDQLTHLAQQETNQCGGIKIDGSPKGLIVYGKRSWETQVLGMEAGSIGPLIVDEADSNSEQIRYNLLDHALNWLKKEGIIHITIRVNVNEVKTLHLLEESGFITVDGILHFSLDLRHEKFSHLMSSGFSEIHCRLYREDDLPQLRAIAAQAYTYGRLHDDPSIDSKTADAAFANWIENACHGLDDAVLVAVYEGVPVGFLTVRINQKSKQFFNVTIGKIWLVAVTGDMRGRGVGQLLMYHALCWFSEHGVDIVEVGTQFRNAGALKFYSRLGFTPIDPVIGLRKFQKIISTNL